MSVPSELIATLDVPTIRNDFPILRRKVHGNPLVYLDNAATTLKPQAVIDVISRHYREETANIHRGVHFLSEQGTAAYEHVRETVRAFIGAHKIQEIIFTHGTTAALNIVAQSYGGKFLQSGDEIIISELEHHSNIVPWQMLRDAKGIVLKVIPINDNGEIMFDEYQKLLGPRTKLVSIAYISNALGSIIPVKAIIDHAHQYEIPVIIDGAQAVAHLPVDVQELDCDFFAFSGHKIFGPTGVGVLYGKEHLLEKMPPVVGGGDMIASVTFEKTTYNTLPYKFEAGTPPIAQVIGLGAALDYVTAVGRDRIADYEQDLCAYGTEVLTAIDGLTLIGTAAHKSSILSFILEGIHPHDIGTIVDQDGVAIRTGHHCAQPVMEHFKVPATARASLSFYNTKEELDILAQALKRTQEIFK